MQDHRTSGHSSRLTTGFSTELPSVSSDGDANGLPQVESGFRRLIGYRMTKWSEGFAEVQLDVGPQHTNVKGTVHGGVLMTLLDGACGRAVAWCAVPGHIRNAVTVNLSVTFIKAPKVGRLTATARVTGGKRIVAVAGAVYDETDTLVAQAQGSFQYFRGHEHRDGVAAATGGGI
jgi:uncharacterized protein (TIGR00369 family)